jgi:hypothetical protein
MVRPSQVVASLRTLPLDQRFVLIGAATLKFLHVLQLQTHYGPRLTVKLGHAIVRRVQRREAVDPSAHVLTVEVRESEYSRELFVERVPVHNGVAVQRNHDNGHGLSIAAQEMLGKRDLWGKVRPGKADNQSSALEILAQYEVSRHGHRRIARIAQAVNMGLTAQTVERKSQPAPLTVSARGPATAPPRARNGSDSSGRQALTSVGPS